MARVDLYPRAELVVGGQLKTVQELTATHGERSPASSLTARVRPTEGGFAGTETVATRLGYRTLASLLPVFGGTIDPDSIRWAPKQVGFSAVGPLRLAMEPTGIEDLSLVSSDPEAPPTYERYAFGMIDATDGELVAGLLALVGIADASLHDTGTPFATLAPSVTSRYAVRLPSDQAPWQLIQEIDTITGCITFDGPDGRVIRLATTGLPSGFVFRTFAEYVDFKDGASRDRGSSQRVINKVTVTGQSGILADGTPYSIQASREKLSPYVPTPPGTRELTFHSDLIETEELAGEVAARLLAKHGRRIETVVLPLKYGDASLRAGMTIAVDSPEVLGVTASTLYRVVEVRHQLGGQGFQTTLVLEGAAAAEGTDPNQAPIPVIEYAIELETLANGDTIAVVALDSSASRDPDGTIALRVWDGDPVVPTPIGDGVRAVVVYNPLPDAPPPTVELTVQDNLGKQATLTREIVVAPGVAYTRELWVAEGTQLAYTADQITWEEYTAVDAVVIPEEAGDEYILAAEADGTAHRVLADGTATALTDLAAITAFFISRDANGVETGVAWAGADDGRLWRSVDYGVSWAAVATLPNDGACHAIQESPYASGDVYAGGGHILWHSYDAGASWQAFYTHDNDQLVITRLASGIAAGVSSDPADDVPVMWIGFASGDASGSDERVAERGGVWVRTLPGGGTEPLDITGLTISLDAERIFVTDSGDGGRAWTAGAGGSGDLAEATAYNPATLGVPRHAIRDGRFPIVWGTGSLATWKSTDEGGSFLVVRAEPGHMLAYGRLVPVATPYPATQIASDGGSERVLTLWNGSGNDTPPDHWQGVTFDASAWPVSQSYGTGTILGHAADLVWDAGARSATEQGLVRRAFTVPRGTPASAQLQIVCNNRLEAAYLNGLPLTPDSLVIAPTGGNGAHVATYDDVRSLLNIGGENVLAIWVRNFDPTPPPSPPGNNGFVEVSFVLALA